MNLNAGGVIGGLAGAAIGAGTAFLYSEPERQRANAKAVVMCVVAGAIVGNFIWSKVFGVTTADQVQPPTEDVKRAGSPMMRLHQESRKLPTDRRAAWNDAMAPGTRTHILIASAKLFIGFCGIAVLTYGVALLASPIAAVVDILRHRRKAAMVEGSCIRVTSEQFPEIHALVRQVARRVGLKQSPEVYVAGLGELNASANKLGRSRQIILSSEIISGAAKTQDAGVLEFVIAHEIAHLYFGHVGVLRSYLRFAHKRLSRLDEFTADIAAAALVADQLSCTRAIALLTVGPDLVSQINLRSLVRQASWVPRNKHTFKAEASETHPMLLHRLANLTGYFERNPSIASTNSEQPSQRSMAA